MSRWPESKRDASGKIALTWRVVQFVLPAEVQIRLTQVAYDAWAQAKGSDFFTLRMALAGEESDIDIGTINPGEMVNPAAYAIRVGVPGSGLKPYSRCNTGYTWTPELYERIRRHESGHDLGIDFHSPTATDLMFESVNATNDPQFGDVNLLRVEYKLPPLGVPTVPNLRDAALSIKSQLFVAAGAKFTVTFGVQNTGQETLTPAKVDGWTDAGARAGQFPGYSIGASGNSLLWQTPRIALPISLAAGDKTDVTATLIAPRIAGLYTLDFQIVDELIDWYGNRVRQDIQVTPAADQPVVPSGPPIGSLVLDGWTPTGWRKV